MPHQTRDSIPAAAQLVLALQTLVSRESDPMLSAVLSVTNLNAGSGAFNVIGETAKLTGTVRTFDAKLRNHIEARIGEVAASIAATFRLTSEYTYGRITEPVLNDPESTDYCRTAAAAIVGAKAVVEMPPIMGGEDFGGFLEARPGAFMAIGQGEDPTSPHTQGLHTSQYDFNDAILPLAAGYFAELAERRLPID
jgi:hippurate hydrolase